MGIVISDSEEIAFNILRNTVQNAQAELERTAMARNAFIELLEVKYKAKLNLATGMLETIADIRKRRKGEKKQGVINEASKP